MFYKKLSRPVLESMDIKSSGVNGGALLFGAESAKDDIQSLIQALNQIRNFQSLGFLIL